VSVKAEAARKWTSKTETAFFERMEEKLDLREERLQKVEDESFGVRAYVVCSGLAMAIRLLCCCHIPYVVVR